jgi:drug/metabolite transporter (DMT)-like permease
VIAHVLEDGLARPTPAQWIGVVLLGATGVFVFNLCFMYALAHMPASRASLIMALNPAMTLLAASLFLREHLTRNKVLGNALALIGVAVVLGPAIPCISWTAASASARS